MLPSVKSTDINTSTPNNIRIIRGGKEYFELLILLIHNAKECIHLQTYIYADDETGMMVSEALIAAAHRGVKIYLMIDGYASQRLSKRLIDEMKSAGIYFRFFNPLFKSPHFYFGRRMHHKVFVADSAHSLVGGMNIADRYNDSDQEPAWLDFAIYAKGAIAYELCVLCWKSWNNFSLKMSKAPCTKPNNINEISTEEKFTIAMRRNDWIRRKNEISATYINMFSHAKKQITIVCSYFLPGKIIRRLLSNAAKRGVKIKVITAGPSDVILAKYAERWMYDWLLRNKIEIYEYQPTVLHAKVALCDNEWFTIGSYNLNNISAYASIELNIDVYNKEITTAFNEKLETIIAQDCIPITARVHAHKKNIFNQFFRWCAYQFIGLVFYLFTFYFKRAQFSPSKKVAKPGTD